MTKLPTDLSGQELIRILTRIGFVFQRQRGSHIILRRESPFARVSVPTIKSFVWGRFVRFFAKQGYQLNS